MCVKYFQTEFSLIFPILCGAVGWFANVIWENSKYKREQKTYYWKEKIDAGKKATEFYLEFLNLLNVYRLQFKLYQDSIIDGESLLVNIQQKESEFLEQKLKQFPHFEYHHINLFYDLIDDENYQIVYENIEILQEINRINQSENINEISELFCKMGHNYEKLYNNVLLLIRKVRKDLQIEVK
jgi:hypothetical protein